MSQSACPTPEELSRQVSIGPDEHFASHLNTCLSCAQAFEAESSMLGMFRDLPWGEPPAAQLSGVRSSLLRQASASPAPLRLPWARLALAAAILLAVGASLFLRLNPSTPQNPTPLYLAKVEATTNSQYAFEGPKDNEIVRLQSGTVTVQVNHLKAGERFRVITGDAEVEVRGTRFDVTAKDNKLVKVVVYEGKVEVRPANGPQRFILPSQVWEPKETTETTQPASTSATTLAVAPADPKKPEVEPRPPKPPSEPRSGRSPSAEAFDAGFALMNEASFDKAAESFLLAATLDPKAPIVEDARFWYATALNRAGKKAKAQSALTSFIAKYPNAPRRGEAAVALGKLLMDAGELDGAQIMFQSAQDDAVPAVQQSAKNGLAAVEKKRAALPQP